MISFGFRLVLPRETSGKPKEILRFSLGAPWGDRRENKSFTQIWPHDIHVSYCIHSTWHKIAHGAARKNRAPKLNCHRLPHGVTQTATTSAATAAQPLQECRKRHPRHTLEAWRPRCSHRAQLDGIRSCFSPLAQERQAAKDSADKAKDIAVQRREQELKEAHKLREKELKEQLKKQEGETKAARAEVAALLNKSKNDRKEKKEKKEKKACKEAKDPMAKEKGYVATAGTADDDNKNEEAPAGSGGEPAGAQSSQPSGEGLPVGAPTEKPKEDKKDDGKHGGATPATTGHEETLLFSQL